MKTQILRVKSSILKTLIAYFKFLQAQQLRLKYYFATLNSTLLTLLSKQVLNISFFFLGGLLVLSFSPFNFYLILPLAFTIFFWLIQKNNLPLKECIFFGLGFFIFGIYWIYICLQKFGGMPEIAAGFSTFSLCLFLSLFFLSLSIFPKISNN